MGNNIRDQIEIPALRDNYERVPISEAIRVTHTPTGRSMHVLVSEAIRGNSSRFVYLEHGSKQGILYLFSIPRADTQHEKYEARSTCFEGYYEGEPKKGEFHAIYLERQEDLTRCAYPGTLEELLKHPDIKRV